MGYGFRKTLLVDHPDCSERCSACAARFAFGKRSATGSRRGLSTRDRDHSLCLHAVRREARATGDHARRHRARGYADF